MWIIIIITLMLTTIQLSGAYLRYLPFWQDLSDAETQTLWKRMLFWSILGTGCSFLYFWEHSVHFTSFKFLLSIGWLPYFLLSMISIRKRAAQHVFVLGMQQLWCFMLHASAGMIVAIFYGSVTAGNLHWQLVCYLFLFLILLPLEQKFFTRLLPANFLMTNTPFRWFIAILPLSIFIGSVLPIVHLTFLATWKDRLARFTIPLFFFLMYRSLSISTHEATERIEQEHANEFMQQQLTSLEKVTHILQDRNERVSVMRHDLRHSYRIIYAFLKNGDTKQALEHIQEQEKLLQATEHPKET